MIKVLFICHGNICRSPMAELVMKDLVGKAGLSGHILPRKKKQSTREVEMQSPTLQRRMPLQGIIAVRRDLRRLWGICI